MQAHIFQILAATLKAVWTITPAERARILRTIRGEPPPAPDGNGNRQPPRVYTHKQAAELLGNKSLRFVDYLAQRGLLKRVTPRGNVRSIGICGESLRDFILGTPCVANDQPPRKHG